MTKNFIKDHPGLEGKEHYIHDFDIGQIPQEKIIMRDGSVKYVKLAQESNTFTGKTLGYIKIGSKVCSEYDIHETQLDKQKVKNAIDKLIEKDGYDGDYYEALKILKIELRL